MWWFVYIIITSNNPPSMQQLRTSPAFHTEEQCAAWLVKEIRSNRLVFADDILATCIRSPEPAAEFIKATL